MTALEVGTRVTVILPGMLSSINPDILPLIDRSVEPEEYMCILKPIHVEVLPTEDLIRGPDGDAYDGVTKVTFEVISNLSDRSMEFVRDLGYTYQGRKVS